MFDDDGGAELLIDDMEFHKAMRTKFGYRGMGHVITEVFNTLDTDGSGMVSLDEFEENLPDDVRAKIVEKLEAGWVFEPAKWSGRRDK